ncbi:tryptophan halogenase family protein [Pseudoalteromonas sp. YIC-656]|uniref:tryptophan halogenase family protein n=1 Tax=Pseudoalteromonas pernae TaxID=3118054 RepID=UPI003242EC20
MNNKIKRIVILGGGTAGWLAASHLGAHYKKTIQAGQLSVTVVESPDVPNVGVGEGTVPIIRDSIRSFGISETELISKCDTSFKQGIKFVEWTHNPSQKPGNFYHHLFETPHVAQSGINAHWLLNNQSMNKHYAQCVSIQHDVCEAGLGPKDLSTPEFQGIVNYAYHLDAGKFTELLSHNAQRNLGVQYISGHVDTVNLTDDGNITSLLLTDGNTIAGDLFVDCSGFQGRLINDELQGTFVDKSDVLLCDSALAVQVPYTDPNHDIKSYTIAHAQQAGWVWDIGLTSRRGVGFVYSSAHLSEDEAYQTLFNYLGTQPEMVRKIPMRTGYQSQPWLKNCVAMGLAQGFVEPLEATGLLVFDMSAKLLATKLPVTPNEVAIVASKFNNQMTAIWEDIVDFIKLHYCISKRDDTAFWLDNRAPETIPQSLRERLQLWRTHIPTHFDFERTLELFKLENYLYVLNGMDFCVDKEAIASRYMQTEGAPQHLAMIEQAVRQVTSALPKHRALLESIKQRGRH